jgi:ABC-2 type transport system permease protein
LWWGISPAWRAALVTGKAFAAGVRAISQVLVVPPWVQAGAHVNPLSYEVNALRALLLGLPSNLLVDFGVPLLAATAGIVAASSLLGRLAQ